MGEPASNYEAAKALLGRMDAAGNAQSGRMTPVLEAIQFQVAMVAAAMSAQALGALAVADELRAMREGASHVG